MIKYTIEKVDTINGQVLFSYEKEGLEKWWRRKALPATFDDEKLHEMAEAEVETACRIFNQQEAAAKEYIVAEPEREVKEVVESVQPDWDPTMQTLEVEYTEDATTKYKNYVVHEMEGPDKAQSIRQKRDSMLAMTDVYALSDRNMSDEMVTYRQELRDVTKQETFPNSVIWPIMPI